MKMVEAKRTAENFPKFLSRVLARQESFEIVQGGIPCACLVPVAGPKCNSYELAEDLGSADLHDEDQHALSVAIRRGRRSLNPLKNLWG
jgi:hypothetical protein